MKGEKRGMGRQAKRVLAFALVAAGVLLCGLGPVWAFHAQDKALFAAAHSYNAPTGSLPLEPQDIPIIRKLYDLEAAFANGVYLENTVLASLSTEAVPELLPRTQAYLEQLVAAGVLSPEIQDYLESQIFVRNELNYSHYLDNYGRESLCCNFGMGTLPPYYFNLTIDISTELVVGMELYLPNELLWEMPSSSVLSQNYVRYLGLAGVQDWMMWQDPTTYYPIEGGEQHFDAMGSVSLSLRVSLYMSRSVEPGHSGFTFSTNSFSLMAEEEIQQWLSSVETGWATSTTAEASVPG